MPKEGLARIYITAKDGASQVLTSIGDRTKALDKETQQLVDCDLRVSINKIRPGITWIPGLARKEGFEPSRAV